MEKGSSGARPEEAPYTVAVAKMKEGVRVLAWIIDTKPERVKIGLKVKLIGKDTMYGPTYAFILEN